MRHTAAGSVAMVLPLVAFGALLSLAGVCFLAVGLHAGFERPSLLSEWRLYSGYQSFMWAASELVLTGMLLGGTGYLYRIRRHRWGLIVGVITAAALGLSFSVVGQIVHSMRADGLLY